MSMPPCSCLPGTDECPSPHVPVYLGLMNVHVPMFLSTWDWWMSMIPFSCLRTCDWWMSKVHMFLSTWDWWMSMPQCSRLPGTDECQMPPYPCLVYLGHWWMSMPPCSCLPGTDECPWPHVPVYLRLMNVKSPHVPVYLRLMNVHAPMFLSTWDWWMSNAPMSLSTWDWWMSMPPCSCVPPGTRQSVLHEETFSIPPVASHRGRGRGSLNRTRIAQWSKTPGSLVSFC